jgi:hypothetical protein
VFAMAARGSASSNGERLHGRPLPGRHDHLRRAGAHREQAPAVGEQALRGSDAAAVRCDAGAAGGEAAATCGGAQAAHHLRSKERRAAPRPSPRRLGRRRSRAPGDPGGSGQHERTASDSCSVRRNATPCPRRRRFSL